MTLKFTGMTRDNLRAYATKFEECADHHTSRMNHPVFRHAIEKVGVGNGVFNEETIVLTCNCPCHYN